MTDTDDRTLVAAVIERGDERAFAALYTRHTPALYGLALRLTNGRDADAEDVVHDAWVRAAERLAEFEWRSALATWLCGFVVRRWREVARQQSRGNELPIDDAGLSADDRRLEGTFDRLLLEQAIAGLAAGYREVLVLHDVHGYTHEEIGALLDIETGTSKSQLARARRAIRTTLGAREGA
ncbi:MAG TPA: RNA polymerase sigma factor [Longimicrobiales bacterium]|nr:RNA polymerase sigma factor [Longimicrobiales bacterium]